MNRSRVDQRYVLAYSVKGSTFSIASASPGDPAITSSVPGTSNRKASYTLTVLRITNTKHSALLSVSCHHGAIPRHTAGLSVPRNPRPSTQHPAEGALTRMLPRAATRGRQDDGHIPSWRQRVRWQREFRRGLLGRSSTRQPFWVEYKEGLKGGRSRRGQDLQTLERDRAIHADTVLRRRYKHPPAQTRSRSDLSARETTPSQLRRTADTPTASATSTGPRTRKKSASTCMA